MKTSSNGKVLYIYNAGATIDLYDAATFNFIDAIQLPGDATTEMFVFPGVYCRPGGDLGLARLNSVPFLDRDMRRALRFVVPYWRRLALVVLISIASTGLTLYLPLLSRDFFDRALVGRDRAAICCASPPPSPAQPRSASC